MLFCTAYDILMLSRAVCVYKSRGVRDALVPSFRVTPCHTYNIISSHN